MFLNPTSIPSLTVNLNPVVRNLVKDIGCAADIDLVIHCDVHIYSCRRLLDDIRCLKHNVQNHICQTNTKKLVHFAELKAICSSRTRALSDVSTYNGTILSHQVDKAGSFHQYDLGLPEGIRISISYCGGGQNTLLKSPK